MKRPLIRENPCDATEVDNTQLKEKSPPLQLPQQTMPTCLATKPDLQDKLTREDVEARARAYSTSFEVDVSKIPQVPKEVQTLGLYYLLSQRTCRPRLWITTSYAIPINVLKPCGSWSRTRPLRLK